MFRTFFLLVTLAAFTLKTSAAESTNRLIFPLSGFSIKPLETRLGEGSFTCGISDGGRSPSHPPENHYVPVADDFNPQVTQSGLDQLLSHFFDRERGEQTVQKVAL